MGVRSAPGLDVDSWFQYPMSRCADTQPHYVTEHCQSPLRYDIVDVWKAGGGQRTSHEFRR